MSSGGPSRRWLSATSASGATPRPAGMRATTTPREAAATRIKSPARTELVQVHFRSRRLSSLARRPAPDRHPQPLSDSLKPDSESLCANATKPPPQGERLAFREPPPEVRAVSQEAHEPLISRKTVAEVPLTGLSSPRSASRCEELKRRGRDNAVGPGRADFWPRPGAAAGAFSPSADVLPLHRVDRGG